MNTLLQRARSSEFVVKQKALVRETRNRLFDPQLRQIERARREVGRGADDVLVLGDSSCLWAAPTDTDMAGIPELVSRRIGGARMVTVTGPGFGPRQYADILRLFTRLERRPAAVVFAMAIRTSTMTHVTRHPVYRYAHVHREIAATLRSGERVRCLGRGSQPSRQDYREFFALEVETRWTGRTAIAHFRDGLRGKTAPPIADDVERMLFEYFHGQVITADNPELPHLTEFARRLRDYGVPATGYWTAPPLAEGERIFPGEFEAHVRSNLAHVQSALAAGDPRIELLDVHLTDDDFIDRRDATEHFALAGRAKIADAIAERLRGR